MLKKSLPTQLDFLIAAKLKHLVSDVVLQGFHVLLVGGKHVDKILVFDSMTTFEVPTPAATT